MIRQWIGWNKSDKGYGYTFLKELALHSSATDEADVHMEEAFGFHPTRNVTHFNSRYLSYNQLATPKERCILGKSRTGSGKSTVARRIALRYSTKRILYVVSSRPTLYAIA